MVQADTPLAAHLANQSTDRAQSNPVRRQETPTQSGAEVPGSGTTKHQSFRQKDSRGQTTSPSTSHPAMEETTKTNRGPSMRGTAWDSLVSHLQNLTWKMGNKIESNTQDKQSTPSTIPSQPAIKEIPKLDRRPVLRGTAQDRLVSNLKKLTWKIGSSERNAQEEQSTPSTSTSPPATEETPKLDRMPVLRRTAQDRFLTNLQNLNCNIGNIERNAQEARSTLSDLRQMEEASMTRTPTTLGASAANTSMSEGVGVANSQIVSNIQAMYEQRLSKVRQEHAVQQQEHMATYWQKIREAIQLSSEDVTQIPTKKVRDKTTAQKSCHFPYYVHFPSRFT